MSLSREQLAEMLLTEIREDCVCRMFDKGPHNRTPPCSTRDRAANLALDILLLANSA